MDSDSSDGNEEDYTETSVLLGFASKEATEDPVSHLGGYPVCFATLEKPLRALTRRH